MLMTCDVDLRWAVRVAQRVDDGMMIVGKQVKGCYRGLENDFKDMLDEFNRCQKVKEREIAYEPLEFEDISSGCCQLCLHKSSSDRKLGQYLGKSYHPECANLWLTRISKEIPSLVPLEDSVY